MGRRRQKSVPWLQLLYGGGGRQLRKSWMLVIALPLNPASPQDLRSRECFFLKVCPYTTVSVVALVL